MRTIRVSSLAALLVVWTMSAAGATIFEDAFDGTSLDLSKWTILDGGYGISVAGGLLTLSGPPDHKRVNTLMQFQPPAGGAVTVSARVYLATQDYNKFGFNVNAMEFPAPTVGFYFDTYETPDTITAIVSPQPGVQVQQTVPLQWGAWYELAVRWSETDVAFLVDGVVVAQFPYAWSAALPVGVWNDRPGTMHADWVRVETSVGDSDGDGVPDGDDACPDSDTSPTVVIDGCDSLAPNVVDASGCTLSDKVSACPTNARNHGDFVSCVAHLTRDGRIIRCAARN